MADRPNPTPQTEATLAAFSGGVIVQTDDGRWVALTPRLARRLAEELPELARAAEDAAANRDLGYFPAIATFKPGTQKPI